MRFKIRGGTVNHGGEPLCRSCRYATVIRGVAQRDEIVECDQLSFGHQRVVFPVTFCTKYVASQHPSLREMEELAWLLRTDAKKNSIGFVRSADVNRSHRFVLSDDEV